MRVGIIGGLPRNARDFEAVAEAGGHALETPTGAVVVPRYALSVGPLVVDLVAHRVTVKGDRVRVTAMQMRLLAHLIEHRDQVVTRAELLKQVWGYQGNVQTRTVDIHVQRLRERLGPAAQLITTVRGIGYRLSEDAD
jgi:two-component system phosphate regulon response regulator PhoB